LALTSAEQTANYPLAAYNFRVTVGGTVVRFAKVSGLQIEHETQTYRDGFSFLDGEQIVRFHVNKYVSVTFEQGTVQDDKTLFEWLEKAPKTMVDVCLCNADGTAVLTWRIRKAVPVRLSAPTLDAKTNEVSIDTFEIKASGISLVYSK
jgi:phage tail-like protein